MASRRTVTILKFDVERAQICFDYDYDTQDWKRLWHAGLKLEKLNGHLEI